MSSVPPCHREWGGWHTTPHRWHPALNQAYSARLPEGVEGAGRLPRLMHELERTATPPPPLSAVARGQNRHVVAGVGGQYTGDGFFPPARVGPVNTASLQTALHHLLDLGLSDGELLDRFAGRRDEAAF